MKCTCTRGTEFNFKPYVNLLKGQACRVWINCKLNYIEVLKLRYFLYAQDIRDEFLSKRNISVIVNFINLSK